MLAKNKLSAAVLKIVGYQQQKEGNKTRFDLLAGFESLLDFSVLQDS